MMISSATASAASAAAAFATPAIATPTAVRFGAVVLGTRGGGACILCFPSAAAARSASSQSQSQLQERQQHQSRSGTATPASRLLLRKRIPSPHEKGIPSPPPTASAAADPQQQQRQGGPGSSQTLNPSQRPSDLLSGAYAAAPPSAPSSVASAFVKPWISAADYMIQLHKNTTYSMMMYGKWLTASQRVTDRADIKHIQRNKRDLLAAVPGAFLLMLPFQQTVLKLVFRYTPFLIPSSFHSEKVLAIRAKVMEEKRQRLSASIAQGVVTAMEKSSASTTTNPKVRSQLSSFEKLASNPANASYSDMISTFSLFRDCLNLSQQLPYGVAVKMASSLGYGLPSVFPKTRLLQWADWVIKDDELLSRTGGVNNLTTPELVEALEERGYIALSTGSASPDVLRTQLANHLKFTQSLLQSAEAQRPTRLKDSAFMRSSGLAGSPALLPEEVGAVGVMVVLAGAWRVKSFGR
ncbi:LETM1-like protein-domain-containing protein [Zopfochytrium polystomum]|nr:LETM1-like protein-domain-containing protein [Zopfochytrium polystomum]